MAPNAPEAAPDVARATYHPAITDVGDFSLTTGATVDFACFALWEGARSREHEIVDDLERHFEVIGDHVIHWTDEHYRQNVARLYEKPVDTRPFSGYSKKIGRTPFRFVAIRDPDPRYTWKQSVSGAIEPSNERVVAAKHRYRDLFDEPYQVHSSNNLTEFLYQASVVLGRPLLDDLLTAGERRTGELDKDLEGADGWRDWGHLFEVLNVSAHYLVLRNFEGLPRQYDDDDIDFLARDMQRLASAANVLQKPRRPYKGTIRIGGLDVATDIRFVGDGYQPQSWQRDMLDRRSLRAGVYVPAPDDHFFSPPPCSRAEATHQGHVHPSPRRAGAGPAVRLVRSGPTRGRESHCGHPDRLLPSQSVLARDSGRPARP